MRWLIVLLMLAMTIPVVEAGEFRPRAAKTESAAAGRARPVVQATKRPPKKARRATKRPRAKQAVTKKKLAAKKKPQAARREIRPLP